MQLEALPLGRELLYAGSSLFRGPAAERDWPSVLILECSTSKPHASEAMTLVHPLSQARWEVDHSLVGAHSGSELVYF